MRGTFLRFHEIGRCKYSPGDPGEVEDWRAPGLIADGIFQPLLAAPPVIRTDDPVTAVEAAPDKMLHEQQTARKSRRSRTK